MSDAATVKITDDSFDTDVLNSTTPVVVDFWAEWCQPCLAVAPALEAIAEEMKGKVVIAKLNIDDNPKFAATYNVRSIPTLILFKDGKPASTQVGAQSKGALENWISSNL